MQMVIEIQENWEIRILNMSDSEIMDFLYTIVRNGTPLPDGAEILTKEAYSDLCLRASRADGGVK